jgi:hypothetical protein
LLQTGVVPRMASDEMNDRREIRAAMMRLIHRKRTRSRRV